MSKTTRSTFSFSRYGAVGAIFAATLLAANLASAATVTCPDPALGTGGSDRQYQTSGAVDCVYNNGNIGQGNEANDAFLNDQGIEEDSYGDASTAGPQFGRVWETIGSIDYVNGAFVGSITGLTITNLTANSFDWTLTGGGGEFALGLVDGGDPKWAVFLLNGTSGTANITSRGGSWSHIVLYGSDDYYVPVPATAALLGLGLLGMGLTRRRAR